MHHHSTIRRSISKLEALGARLSKAAANVPPEIEGLYERYTTAEEGKKLIPQA